MRWTSVAILISLAVACQDAGFDPPPRPGTNNASNNGPAAKSFGEACLDTAECRAGLVCLEEVCGAAGDVTAGQPCELTAQCEAGLFCNALTASCEASGEAGLGEECGTPAECESGWVCRPQGFSGECVAGWELDVGASCGATTDCLAGLNCASDPLSPEAGKVCVAGPGGLVMPWTGAECTTDEGAFRAYFEVPDGAPLADFYRHPYPSDVRLKDGRPVLDGHPTPGDGLLGVDIVQKYLDAIEATQEGFSPNSTVYLRFSKSVDLESLKGDGRPVMLVNIDPDSPGYGDMQAFSWFASTGRNRYICPNFMALRPANGKPLAGGTTYAMVLSTAVKDSTGGTIVRDADFEAMLAETRPDGVLGAAWDAYGPLRAYLADAAVSPPAEAEVAFAAVFTTGQPTGEMSALATAAAADLPTVSALTRCDAATVSPCDDGLEGDAHVRGCFGEETSFAEVHGKISLPVFQAGEAPYLVSGGAADPTVKRREDVCFAMSVPKDSPPPTGWPVLLVAHGTGGNFRGHLDDLAPGLTEIDIDGTAVKFVTLGWDQVLHHTRRGMSEKHPNGLVYNYANPDAALGNFLQGGAEISAIVSWVASNPLTAEVSPTGEAIPLDAAQIWFLGHSQGGTTGPLVLPFESRIRGAVLSGAGAGLAHALLGKTSPVNSPEALKLVLQDASVGENHPVISLLQGYFDRVDPLNFAGMMTWRSEQGVSFPKHVFHTHGVTDTFTPPAALDTMAVALRATYVEPMVDPITGVTTAPAPVSGNLAVEAVPYSVLGRQYEPAGYDGHFVLFREAAAQGDLAEFLGTGVVSGVPEIR